MKIVTVGGGTGQRSLIRELVRRPNLEVTAIVNVSDNGGHAGFLREDLDIPAIGDLRNNILSVSDSKLARLADYRFNKGNIKGVHLGNMIFASIVTRRSDLLQATKEFCDLCGARASVLPVVSSKIDICAELEDGAVIVGEKQILSKQSSSKIKTIFIKPELKANQECIDEILAADLIVISPGKLYTSVLATLVFENMVDAFRKTNAKKLLICNLMNHPTETYGFRVEDYVREIEKYIDSKLDFVLVNNGKVSDKVLEHYKSKNYQKVEPIEGETFTQGDFIPRRSFDDLQENERAVGKGMFVETHLLRHDMRKVVDCILELVK